MFRVLRALGSSGSARLGVLGRGGVSLTVAAVLATSVTAAVTEAAAAPPGKRPPVQQEKVVAHTDAGTCGRAEYARGRQLSARSWPGGG